jgi:hypothetical protein
MRGLAMFRALSAGQVVLPLLVLHMVLSGCATSGVSPALVPYHSLSKADGGRLGAELVELLTSMPLNTYAPLNSVPHAICRTGDGYFLAPFKNGAIDISPAMYLGAEPQDAFERVDFVRQTIQNQQYVAQQQRQAAIAAALAAYSSYEQAPAPASPSIPEISGGDVVGLGLAGTQRLLQGETDSGSTQYPSRSYSAPQPHAHSYSGERRVRIFQSGGSYWGFLRPAGSADGKWNVYKSPGEYVGFARPSGSADGKWNVYDSQAQYVGFIRP